MKVEREPRLDTMLLRERYQIVNWWFLSGEIKDILISICFSIIAKFKKKYVFVK